MPPRELSARNNHRVLSSKKSSMRGGSFPGLTLVLLLNPVCGIWFTYAYQESTLGGSRHARLTRGGSCLSRKRRKKHADFFVRQHATHPPPIEETFGNYFGNPIWNPQLPPGCRRIRALVKFPSLESEDFDRAVRLVRKSSDFDFFLGHYYWWAL